MASGRQRATLCQTSLCLLVLLFRAQLAVEAHTDLAATPSIWLRRRVLRQIGQQATIPSLPPRACATITPHTSVIQAALNATSAKAEQLKHSPGIESASALVNDMPLSCRELCFHLLSMFACCPSQQLGDQMTDRSCTSCFCLCVIMSYCAAGDYQCLLPHHQHRP